MPGDYLLWKKCFEAVLMDIIDCLGDMCPIPMIKVEKMLELMKPGDEFMVVSDHSCTVASIREKYFRHITKIDEVMIGVWEIFLKK